MSNMGCTQSNMSKYDLEKMLSNKDSEPEKDEEAGELKEYLATKEWSLWPGDMPDCSIVKIQDPFEVKPGFVWSNTTIRGKI